MTRVLVIEDAEAIRTAVESGLVAAGHELFAVNSMPPPMPLKEQPAPKWPDGQPRLGPGQPMQVDGELHRVGVLELVDEDVVDVRQHGVLSVVEAPLDGGEVEDVLRVEVGLPPLLQGDQVGGQTRAGHRLNAVERPCGAAIATRTLGRGRLGRTGVVRM